MSKFTIQRIMLFYLMITLSLTAFSQQLTISGKITTTAGESLAGATVRIKALNRSTSTSVLGEYRFDGLAAGNYIVEVNSVGYVSQSKSVATQNNSIQLDFTLESDQANIDEVVVIGYGTQRRGEVTGAVSTVNEKDFQKGVISSPEQLITGKVSGVQITSGGGQPGAASTIRIRAGASLNASNDPLIVVDGVPFGGQGISGVANPLSLINPNDIETFTVLKDANATAIYGSRASNGVILITTKKGSRSPKINFSTQNSYATIDRTVDLLDANQIRDYVNANGSDVMKALLGSENTDWQDAIYRNAFASDNNLSVASSVKNIPYRVSLGYLNQDGVLKNDNMQRTSAALSLNPKLLDNHLTIDLNVRGAWSKSKFATQDAIGAAIQFDPTQPIYSDQFGGYYEWANGTSPNPNAPRNPLALLDLRKDNGQVFRTFGNIQLDYSFHFLPKLHANLNLGYDKSRGEGNTFTPAIAARNFNEGGERIQYKNDIDNTMVEFYLKYANNFENIKSNIDATLGYGYYDNKTTVNNFDRVNEAGDVLNAPVFPFDVPQNRLISYYGRLIYTYDSKYIVSATLRADGSSRFSPANRWGYFPSVAFTWKLKEEGFLQYSEALSDLKLRLSYGQTGQQDGIANYSYMPNYINSSNESMYRMGDEYYYLYSPVAYDENIRWESTTTSNIGVDYGFANGRIFGSLDVYTKKTKDLLSSIPVAVGSNFNNFLLTNVGNMENFGVEWNINGALIKREKLNWDLGFNFTYNTNKVTNLTLVDDPDFMIETGGIQGATGNNIQAHTVNMAPNSFRVFKQVYDEVGKPVEALYADTNGDGTISDNDRYFYKSPLPKFILGFSTSVDYDKWSIGTVLRANIGNYIYDNVSSNFGSSYNVIDAASLVINNAPVDFLNTNFREKQLLSDYYVKNASFLKMDNINVSYRIGNVLKGNRTASLTLSGTVQNVFTVSKYKGVDPEIANGIDNRFYPRPRTFIVGVNLAF